jgi:hypothetical protein
MGFTKAALGVCHVAAALPVAVGTCPIDGVPVRVTPGGIFTAVAATEPTPLAVTSPVKAVIPVPGGTAKVASAFRNFPAAADPAPGAGTLPADPPDPVSPIITGSVALTLTVGAPASSAKTTFCFPLAGAGVAALKFALAARVMVKLLIHYRELRSACSCRPARRRGSGERSQRY